MAIQFDSSIDVDGSVNIDGTLFVNANNNHIRLIDTDNTGNFSVGVNSNFQIRDITANTTPLTIRAGTPGDTILTTASGRVGIGLSTPGTTLHVNGFTRINGGLQMNTANATIYQILDSALRFGTNNTERMRITNTGQVGIGITAITASVNADDLQIGNGTGGNRGLTVTAQSNSGAAIYFGDADNTNMGSVRYDNSNDSMKFFTNTSEQIRITSSGNVGIGTDSPDLKLQVGGTTDSNGSPGSFNVAGSYGVDSWARAYVVSNTNILSILQANNTALQNGGAYRVTGHIDGTGTDQSSRAVFWNQNGTWFCNVTGQSGASSNSISFLVDATTGLPSVKTYHANNYTVRVWHERINLNEGTGTDNSRHYFGADAYMTQIGNDISMFTTTYSGNNTTGKLGIGIVNASERLHVVGNARVTGAYYDSNNSPGTANQVLVSTVSGTDWVDGSGSSIIGGPYLPLTGGTLSGPGDLTVNGDVILGGSAQSPKTITIQQIGVTTTDTNAVMQDGNGVLKIRTLGTGAFGPTPVGNYLPLTAGSGSPLTGNLYLEGAAQNIRINNGTQPVVFLGDGGANTDGQLLLYSSTGAANVVFNGDNQNHYITNGNVGIGTTSPDYKLEVSGTLGVNRTDGIIFAGSGGPGFGNKITSDTQNNFIFSTSLPSAPYTISPRATILNNGNVGIGTTNPGTKLEIAGGDSLLELNTTSATGNPYMMWSQAGTRRSYMQHVDSGDNLTIASEYGGMIFRTGTSGAEVERMRILSSGNVGIGETNPDTLLHITGNEPTIKLEDNVAGDYYNPKIEFFGFEEGGTLEYISNPGFSGMRLHYRNTGLNQDTYLELKNGQAAFTSANITGGVNVSMTGELQVFGGDTSYFSNGNVAIGTTTASEKLYVVGNTSVSNNVYIGPGNTLKACTYSAQYSLVVGQNNVLGGISNGIIGVSNTIACTNEPWLNFGGNFIAGINNEINNLYSHANAVFGQSNAVGAFDVSTNSVAGILVGGQSNTTNGNNSLAYGFSNFTDQYAEYSLTGGYDSNNFGLYGSVAIGAGATASAGNNQYAFGSGVTTPTFSGNAYGADQFVVGKYNEYTNSSFVPHRFAVGNGLSDVSRDTPFCVIGGGTYTNGQVSINDADGFAYTSVPYSIFHVNGRATSSYSSTFTVTSDERLKKDILDYNKGLAEILQVQPKSYSFNGKANTIEGVKSIGVLAQEIKEVFPETVGTVNKRLNPEDEQETELYTVDINSVTYALINAVKELNAKIETLESRIQTLEGS